MKFFEYVKLLQFTESNSDNLPALGQLVKRSVGQVVLDLKSIALEMGEKLGECTTKLVRPVERVDEEKENVMLSLEPVDKADCFDWVGR